MLKKIIKLLLIIIWMGVIFSFSSDNGDKSETKSDSVIIKIYKIFNNRELTTKEKEHIIDIFVTPVRKLAHFTEYFILGLLVISFISEYTIINIKSLLIALLICCLYAVSDEIHQLFTDGRAGRVLDVLIDTTGSLTAILIYYKMKRRKI